MSDSPAISIFTAMLVVKDFACAIFCVFLCVRVCILCLAPHQSLTQWVGKDIAGHMVGRRILQLYIVSMKEKMF